MCKFKRSLGSIISLISLGLFCFCIGRMILEALKDPWGEPTPSLVVTAVLCMVFILLHVILICVVPPDFNYYIRVYKDYLIFEISEDDHRRLSKTFVIANKTWRYLTLDDGFTRMRIAYNKKVLQFLSENTIS